MEGMFHGLLSVTPSLKGYVKREREWLCYGVLKKDSPYGLAVYIYIKEEIIECA